MMCLVVSANAAGAERADLPVQTPSSASDFAQLIHSSGLDALHAQRIWDALPSGVHTDALQKAMEVAAKQENPSNALQMLSEVIPLERLQALIRLQYPSYTDGLRSAHAMLSQAQVYLESTEHEEALSWKVHLQSALDRIHFLLDTLFKSFGLQAFLDPAEDEVEAGFRSQQVMALFSFFSMITAAVPFLGTTGLLIVGGVVISVAALSLIYPFIKPVPSSIPNGVNWSKMVREGSLDAAEGRKDLCDEIAGALTLRSNVKTHPMLIGPSGVGKTETVKAFTKAIERGDYPELAGKQVFYINTADLVNNSERFGSGNRNLEKIRKALRNHREDVILVFDEVHLACQRREQVVLADQLKSMLDPGRGSFPYVVAMTTEQEFFRDIYAGNEAFARRFHRISMSNPADAETKNILLRYSLRNAPDIMIEAGALTHLIEKVKTCFGERAIQPATGIKILSKCIQKLSAPEEHSLDHRIEQVRDEIAALNLSDAFGASEQRLQTQNVQDQAKRMLLEKRLERLQQERRGYLENHVELRDLRKKLVESKQEMCRLAQKIASFSQGVLNAEQKKEIARFTLLSYGLIPELEKEIVEVSRKLGLKVSIDKSLIDEMIAEEVAREQKIQQSIARGRTELSERK